LTGFSLPDLDSPSGRVAREDFVRLWEDETVEEALTRLRSEKLGERIVYFYVTDPQGNLRGVVPTRRLLLSDPGLPVRQIMAAPAVSVEESAPLREALAVLTAKRYLALPVVDKEGRLTGVLDLAGHAGGILDWERRETLDEWFQLVGIHLEQEQRRNALQAVRHRFPWLLCNLAGGVAAAFLSRHFDHLLSSFVALAFFVPLILTIAESVAMQSVIVSLNHIQIGGAQNSSRGAFRELGIGTLLGSLCGGVAGLVGALWLGALDVTAVAAGGILCAGAAGAVLGFLGPRLIRSWHLDPKVAAGPAVLAVTDMVALTCYFLLAAAVFHARG